MTNSFFRLDNSPRLTSLTRPPAGRYERSSPSLAFAHETTRGGDAGAFPAGWAAAGGKSPREGADIPVGAGQLVTRKVASLRPVAVVIGSSLSSYA